jgi:hypothetical protein
MAASRKAARSSSRTPRRRPGRRPPGRRGASRVQWDKVGRVALTLVLAAVLYSYLHPALDFVNTYRSTSQAKVIFHEALRENKRLHRRVQRSGDPVALDEMARNQGMIAAEETPYVVDPVAR